MKLIEKIIGSHKYELNIIEFEMQRGVKPKKIDYTDFYKIL